MDKKVIAVDVDEVLANTIKSILKKYNYVWNGKNVKREDLTDYNLWNIKKFGLTKNKAMWMFVKFQMFSGFLKKIDVIDGAKEKLLSLKEKGYKIYAITARLSLVKYATKVWLNKNFKGCFDGVIFANFFTKWARKKSDICKELGVGTIIEDNLETCIDCESQGIKCYLLDKPRNQFKNLPEGVTRVYSWSEIVL